MFSFLINFHLRNSQLFFEIKKYLSRAFVALELGPNCSHTIRFSYVFFSRPPRRKLFSSIIDFPLRVQRRTSYEIRANVDFCFVILPLKQLLPLYYSSTVPRTVFSSGTLVALINRVLVTNQHSTHPHIRLRFSFIHRWKRFSHLSKLMKFYDTKYLLADAEQRSICHIIRVRKFSYTAKLRKWKPGERFEVLWVEEKKVS